MLFKIIVKDVHEIFGLYLSPRPFKNSQSDHTAPSSISPPITWRPFLLKLELLEALIEVYIRIRSFPASGPQQSKQEARTHALRQLLTQLASLQGPIFPSGQERGQYAAFLVRAGVELLSQSMEGAMAAAAAVSAAGGGEEMERVGLMAILLELPVPVV